MTGTPACIWRYTGELVAVNKEFLYLSGWSLNVLVERPYRIYELFDKMAFLQYYEEYTRAFTDSCINYFQLPCQILKYKSASPMLYPDEKSKQHVDEQLEYLPFLCWITIKRDLFDMPSLIFGHFLPSF